MSRFVPPPRFVPPDADAEAHSRPTQMPPAAGPASDVRVRVAAPVSSERRIRVTASVRPEGHFANWVRSTAPLPPESDEVVRLETLLLRALRSRDAAAALHFASRLVYVDPGHEVARRIKDRCVQQAPTLDTREFPRAGTVPRMQAKWEDLLNKPLSREAAYLLWCIDGHSTLEEVLDIAAMPPLAAYEALDALVREGIVSLS